MEPKNVADRLFHWAGISAWVLFLGLFLSDLARASSPFEDPQRIRDAASAHARSTAGGDRVQASARLPDSRLRLKRCEQDLQTRGLGRGQRLQVQVACPGVWKIYVPVTVQMQRQIVIAKRSLRVNEIVSRSDLAVEWRDVQGNGYGSFDTLESVIGRELARPVRAGQVIQPNQLRQAVDIRKGDIVTLVSRAGPVEIRGRGRAEQDAVENTRNLSSGRIVEGYARPDGIVEIQG